MTDTSVLQVEIDPSGASRGAAEVESAIGKMSNSAVGFLEKVRSAFDSLTSFIKRCADAFGDFFKTLLAVDSLKGLLDRMIDVNVTFNAFIATMAVVKGSIQAANAEFKYLSDYTRLMGGNLEGNIKSYTRVAAAFKEIDATGESTRHVFEAVTQAQTLLHTKSSETARIFLALDQTIGKGKVSLEELQRQLGNSLPGAMDTAAKAMNMTQSQFRDAITKGTLDPLEVVLKLANQIKREYGGGAMAVVDQFTANLNRLKQSVFELYLAVGQSGAMDGLNNIIKALTGLFNDENTGAQFGASLKELFNDIATWISKITASDIKDFFDGLSGVVKTFVLILREMIDAFGKTVDGKADFLSFADVVSQAMVIMTDAALTVVAAIAAIPISFMAAYADVKKWTVQFTTPTNDITTGKPNPQYAKDIAEATAEQDKWRAASERNMAIILNTDDSPSVKMMKKRDELFANLRKNREVQGSQPKTSSLAPGTGGVLSDDKIDELTSYGNGAPPAKPKKGRDVFNAESVALAKAESLATLEYNNLLDNKVKLENKNSVALETKIKFDKDYMTLGSAKLNQLRAMAASADEAQARERAAEAFVADRLSLNKQIYSSEQALLDITEYRDANAEKNQRTLQEKFLFDARYLAMNDQLKNSLMDQAKAADILAVAIASATRVEQSRYSTLIDTLQTQRNIENQSNGLGPSKYIEEQKVLDSFLKGGVNQFASLSEAAALWADAVQKDINAVNRDISSMSFSIDEQIKQFDFEAQMVGNTATEIQKLTGVKKLYDQMRLNGIDLTLEENKGYKDMVDLIGNKLSGAIDKVAARQADWTNGLKSGVASYIDSIANVAKSMENVVTKAFKGLEDQLVSFATTGKLSFGDMAKSIIADIVRIAVQMQITGPVAKWFRDQMSGTGSSWGDAASSAAGLAGGASGGGAGAIGMATQAYGLYNNASKLYSTVSGWFGAGSAAASMGALGATGVTTTALGAGVTSTAGAITGAGAGGLGLTAGGSGLGFTAGTAGAAEVAGTAGAITGAGAATAAGGTAAAAGGSGLMAGLAAIPVYGWIAAAVLAVLAFGMGGDKEITGGGIQGKVSGNKFSGNAYQSWEQDGGWFGSDSSGRDLSELPDGVKKTMGESVDALYQSFDKMGSAIKLGSGFLNGFTSGVDINLTGLKPEEQAKMLDVSTKQIADNMATVFIDKLKPSISATTVIPGHYDNTSNESGGDLTWIDEVKTTTTKTQEVMHTSIDAYIGDVIRITDTFRQGSYGVAGAEGTYADFVKVMIGLATTFQETNGMIDTFGQSIDFKTLEASAKTGETVIETFSRLNNLFTTTNAIAAGMGKSVSGAFGSLGLASTDARQRMVDAAGGVDALQKSFAAYSSTYLDSFKQIQPTFQAVADASKSAGVYIGTTKDQFVALVNSLDLTTQSGANMFAALMKIAPTFAQIADSITNATTAFDDVFLTDSQKTAKAAQQLSDQFSKLGYTGITTVDQFRKIVGALDLTTASGQAMYVALSQLAPAFSKISAAANQTVGADRKSEVLARRQAQANALASSSPTIDQDLLNKQRQLEIDLLKAQGRDEAALNLTRQMSLDSMEPQLRAMQQQVWAAQDQAEALQKAADASKAAMEQLQSNVDTAFDLLTRSVDAQKATLKTAYDDQVKSIQSNLKVQQDLAKTQSKTASDSLKSIQDILNSLNNALKSTDVSSPAIDIAKRREAQNTLNSALSYSNAGGSLSNFSGLDDAISNVSKPSTDMFSSFTDYARDQARTANTLTGLRDNAQGQVTVAQMTLDAINTSIDTMNTDSQNQIDALTAGYDAQVKSLDDIVATAKDQIDVLRGIDTSVVAVSTAVTQLGTAILAVQQATAAQTAQAINAIANPGSTTSTASGPQMWTANGYVSYDAWQKMVQEGIDHAGDGTDSRDYINASQLKSGASQTDVMNRMLTDSYGVGNENSDINNYSDAYKAAQSNFLFGSKDITQQQYNPVSYIQTYQSKPTFADNGTLVNSPTTLATDSLVNKNIAKYGSDSDLSQILKFYSGTSYFDSLKQMIVEQHGYLPSYAVGTPFVDGDQTARIHDGEMVVDRDASNYFRRYFGSDAPSSDDSGMRAELEKVNVALVAIAKSNSAMARKFEKWDGDGMPETRDLSVGI